MRSSANIRALVLFALCGWNAVLEAVAQAEEGNLLAVTKDVANDTAVNAASSFSVQSYPGGPSADEIGAQCETLRRTWHAKWLVGHDCEPWQPPCEVVVHRHRSSYQQAVGRAGAATSGSSLVRRTQEQKVSRRIDLLIAADNELPALAHELVHVILADVFPDGFPPLWVDEGLAMLSDTPVKQNRHWRDCHQAVKVGTALPLRELLHLDRPPSPAQFPAVYGQSLSLARFFAQRGRPEQMLAFVHHAHRAGYVAALKEIYDLDGFHELETAWRRFVRTESEGSRVSQR